MYQRIAIVCDWLTNNGGAEHVVRTLHEMFPKAPIYTTLYDPKNCHGFENADIRTSFLQKIPILRNKHQLLLGLMPLAIESFDLSEYDLIISSSHSVAKGVITKPGTVHICYCHTPMRYAWEHWELESRLKNFPKFLHNHIRRRMHKLRIWDRLTADRVDHFIANSTYVAERIKKYYRREAEVIHPPVDIDSFKKLDPSLRSELSAPYYLMVGRLIPYKKFDLAIEAFNLSGKKLIIAGEGPDLHRLKSLAKPNVTLLGHVEQQTLVKLYSECQALIFPQIEDFGIAQIEAMASGRPVIAYYGGGATDTIVNNENGLLFGEQTIPSINEAVNRSESLYWNTSKIKAHSEKYSTNEFKKSLMLIVNSLE